MLPFMKRFHSVGDLYLRVKWTMPANWQNSLSAADYLNVGHICRRPTPFLLARSHPYPSGVKVAECP